MPIFVAALEAAEVDCTIACWEAECLTVYSQIENGDTQKFGRKGLAWISKPDRVSLLIRHSS